MNEVADRITKVVELAAPMAQVWQALTDHEEFGAWFQVKLEGPFVPRQITSGRMTYPGHEGLLWRALVERMEPERLFSFSWYPFEEDPGDDFSASPSTLVSFKLEPTPRGTRLTITESGFAALGVDDPQALEALRRNKEGWEILAGHIITHVGTCGH